MKSKHLKQLIYLFLLIVVPLLSFSNDQADGLFARGNDYYAKGQYQHALNTYRKVLNGGSQSAKVYFNIGNAYYKIDNIPSALLYYEKAHMLLPNDEDINLNIRLASSKTIDKIEEVPELFLNRWWESAFLSFSLDTFSVLSLVLVLLGAALLILYFFAYSVGIKKATFYTAISFFILGGLTIFMAGRQVSYFENRKQAIVFASPVTVKSAPNDRAKILFVIHEGTKVSRLETDNGWTKIKLANGNEGWMKAIDLKGI